MRYVHVKVRALQDTARNPLPMSPEDEFEWRWFVVE